jgi:hypothetical protein
MAHLALMLVAFTIWLISLLISKFLQISGLINKAIVWSASLAGLLALALSWSTEREISDIFFLVAEMLKHSYHDVVTQIEQKFS